MMSPELLSILVLALMFVVATVAHVNIGALAFVAAFVVGTTIAGLQSDDILGGFPGDLFVLLVGITYLFAIAQNNGTIDWLVGLAVRAVSGRLAAIPWVIFGIGAVLTAIGAPSPGACAILAPIAMSVAAKYRINQLLMGVMLVHGTQAGSFSPISVYGGIVNSVVTGAGLPTSPLVLFFASLGTNALFAAVAFLVLGGRGLLRQGQVELGGAPSSRPAPAGGSGGTAPPAGDDDDGRPGGTGHDEDTEGHAGPNLQRVLTLLGIVTLAVTALAFDLDVGFVAMTVAVVLALISPQAQRGAVAQVSWSVVLLITGVLTYVFVLEELGTIDYVGTAVASLGTPVVVALLLCYVGGVVSAFASSTAILGATIPLAVPFLLAGEVGAIGMIAALSVSSVIVDVSPFSTNGALVLANAIDVDRDAFYRRLLVYGAVITVVGPALAWLAFVLPTLP